MSVNYSGEVDVHSTDGQFYGQFNLFAPAGAGNLFIQYVNGSNPIKVRGINIPLKPEPPPQDPGTSQTYTIPNPEDGVVVNYSGSVVTIQWNWLP